MKQFLCLFVPVAVFVVSVFTARFTHAKSPVQIPAEATTTTTAVKPEHTETPGVDYNSEIPPPTEYDRIQKSPLHDPASHGLLWQLVRTVLGLAFVVALIYLLAKLVLPKMAKFSGLGVGKHMRVVERMALDTKHMLYLVELDNAEPHASTTSTSETERVSKSERMLIATSNHGVQCLAHFKAPQNETPKRYEEAMQHARLS